MAEFIELYVDQGTTYRKKIYLTDDATRANINIAGYSFASQMRKSYYSQNASANITCTITDASNGEVTLTLSDSVSSNLRPMRYLFDLEATTPGGDKERVVEGIIHLHPEVTK